MWNENIDKYYDKIIQIKEYEKVGHVCPMGVKYIKHFI